MEIKFNFDRKNVQIGFQNQFIIENFTNNLLVKILPGRGPKGDSYVLEEEDKQEIADIVSQQANTELEKYKTIYNVLPKVSGEGTDIELKDTGNAMLVFDSFNGKISQITTTGKNLFNKENYTNNKIVSRNNGELATNNSYGTSDYIEVKANETYYQSGTDAYYSVLYNENKDFYGIIGTAKFTPEINGYIRASFKRTNIDKVQIEIGEEETEYEPYSEGKISPSPEYIQPIKIVTGEQNLTIQNKNLLPFNNQNFSIQGINFYCQNGKMHINGSTNAEISSVHSSYKNNFKFTLPAGTYTFSLYLSQANSTRIVTDSGTTLATLTGTGTQHKATFTLEKTKECYLGIYIYKQSYNNVLFDAQLEPGNEATERIGHEEQNYQLSLDNIKLANIENYKNYIFKNVTDSPYYNADLDLNDWYLHKEIIGENLWEKAWVYESASSTPVPRTVLRLRNMSTIHVYFSNCFLSSEMNNQQIANKLKTDSPNWFLSLANSLTGIETTDSSNIKLNKITTFLQSISANIYYRLITPTNTKITDTTLIQQLENINNNARSYKDTTIITYSSESEDNETIQASVTALKDISTLFEQVNNAIIEIGGGE